MPEWCDLTSSAQLAHLMRPTQYRWFLRTKSRAYLETLTTQGLPTAHAAILTAELTYKAERPYMWDGGVES